MVNVMQVIKISAFSDGSQGGNPAGVVLFDEVLPAEQLMQQTAADVGFSETVFAARELAGNTWRVRYFSPESEVPFCGHATIALGAVLAREEGAGTYSLNLNNTQISVVSTVDKGLYHAALQSPLTQSRLLDDSEIATALSVFGYQADQLDGKLPSAHMHGGADHLFFSLQSRKDLSAMQYDLEAGKAFMRAQNIVTIMFAYRETDRLFHVRNAFAFGGVLEDPATGAAAAAFSGYLRDIGILSAGEITLVQGEDMGKVSRIHCAFDATLGSSITVSGQAREMT